VKIDTNSVLESRKKMDRPAVTATLGRWIAEVRYAQIPAEIVEFAKRAIADTVGVALAARDEDVSRLVIETVAGEPGPCSIWGTAVKTTARNAALANGTMAHAHDLDDNNMSMVGHASAPVVPAVFALADEVDASGADIVLAYIVGVEVEGKLGLAMTYEHNGRGWHTTSTLGAIGAAAASAKLLQLDAAAAQHALGIAASMASGLRQNFGTMTKPLHAGIAAQNGVLAAKLAAKGLNASPQAIEGHEGFFDLFTDPQVTRCEQAIKDLGKKFELLENMPKIHASCALVHTAVDIVQAGLQSGGIQTADIASVKCGVSYHALNLMRYGDPKDHLEARFSIPYCVAAALIFGKLGIAEFRDDVVSRPEVHQLIKNIDVYVLPEFSTQELFQAAYLAGKTYTDLEVTHKSGKVFKSRLPHQKGHSLKPLTAEEFRLKFFECLGMCFAPAAAQKTWARLMDIEKCDPAKPAAFLSKEALAAGAPARS
jgi:2-methylcitrate dehydratase PrpD